MQILFSLSKFWGFSRYFEYWIRYIELLGVIFSLILIINIFSVISNLFTLLRLLFFCYFDYSQTNLKYRENNRSYYLKKSRLRYPRGTIRLSYWSATNPNMSNSLLRTYLERRFLWIKQRTTDPHVPTVAVDCEEVLCIIFVEQLVSDLSEGGALVKRIINSDIFTGKKSWAPFYIFTQPSFGEVKSGLTSSRSRLLNLYCGLHVLMCVASYTCTSPDQ